MVSPFRQQNSGLFQFFCQLAADNGIEADIRGLLSLFLPGPAAENGIEADKTGVCSIYLPNRTTVDRIPADNGGFPSIFLLSLAEINKCCSINLPDKRISVENQAEKNRLSLIFLPRYWSLAEKCKSLLICLPGHRTIPNSFHCFRAFYSHFIPDCCMTISIR